MALFPERFFGRGKETVTQRPEAPEIPEELARKTGIEKVETSFPATARDAQGPPLVQTPQQPVSVQVPAPSLAALEEAKKGPKESTSPWNALFWIRAIQKAIHFGKKIIFGVSP